MRNSEQNDGKPGLAEFEYFRYQSWRAKSALTGFIENVKFTRDSDELVKKLKSVANELMGAANQIETDIPANMVQFFTEDGKEKFNHTIIEK